MSCLSVNGHGRIHDDENWAIERQTRKKTFLDDSAISMGGCQATAVRSMAAMVEYAECVGESEGEWSTKRRDCGQGQSEEMEQMRRGLKTECTIDRG